MATKPVFAEDDKRRPSATDIAGIPHDSDSGEYGTKTERPDEVYEQLPFWTRMGCTPESFKRRTAADEHNQLNRTLKGRHLHMIAIGGSIGAGLFVGTGSALRRGGAASLLIDYMIIGSMIFNVVFALGEMSIMYPISGGFYTYSTRFIDPSWGFAMGWNYCMQWTVVLPLEIVIAAETIQYWDQTTNIAVWITMFMVVLVLINVFGVLGYGEEEFLTSLLKLSAIVVFLFIGIILVCGGGPESGIYNQYWGARYWYDPGAFQNGFKGFCSVFVTAAFAFAGTELVGLAAAESKTPLLSLPSAVKQVFWRIILFYILALLFVGMLISPEDPRLIGAGGGVGTASSASPFVLVGNYAGLAGFDSFMNVVICVSVISIGNSGIYGGSRTLTALAEQGYAPKIFAYVDRAGRPLMSTIAIISFGLLSYVALASSAVEVFDWLLALSGLSSLFTWGSICFAHIRFRQAWKYHGHSLDELPFKAIGGAWGSYYGIFVICMVLVAQFYVALFPPLNDGEMSDAAGFFKSYLALPVVIFFWVCGYIWKRSGWLKLSQMDVDSGRRTIDWETHNARMEARRNASFVKRIGYFLF